MNFVTRKGSKTLFNALKILLAIGIAYLLTHVLTRLAQPFSVSAIWVIAIVIAQNLLMTSTPRQQHSQTENLMTVILASILYLVYFGATREYYSLTFLALANFLWLSVTMSATHIVNTRLPKPTLLFINHCTLPAQYQNQFNLVIAHDPNQFSFKNIDAIITDPAQNYDEEWAKRLTHAHILQIPIQSLSALKEELEEKVDLDAIARYSWQEPILVNNRYTGVKRVIDLGVILLFSPFLILLISLTSLTILINMGRPLFFTQERIGRDNKPFKVIKFRTMITNAEAKGPQFASADDQRITKLGHFLRKYRLDELPQIFNIIRGEMSFIGPRPEQKKFVEEFTHLIPAYPLRHCIRPGISGWAQIKYGYAATVEDTKEKLGYDLYYLKYQSLWFDIRIAILTIKTVLTGFGSR